MSSTTFHIFVVSNPISCIHASVLMKQFMNEENKSVLILDKGKRKVSFNQEILNCAGKDWNYTIDLGDIIDDSSNLKPNLRKRITRKIKHVWPLKPVYDRLLNKYLERYNNEIAEKLKNSLNFIDPNKDEIKVYMLTQTMVNSALVNLFPKAHYNYFEHGLPDYLFSFRKNEVTAENFYCLFHSGFLSYTQNHKLAGPAIKPLMNKDQYLNHCRLIFDNNSVIKLMENKIPVKSVLIIMQSLEKYELGIEFWLMYLKKIAVTEKGVFILKPHPHQSNEVLQKLSEQLRNNGIQNIILNDSAETSFSSEVLFSTLHYKFSAVYSPFSYSVYFLSYLFKQEGINFHESYAAMKAYIGKAPQQYQKQFLEHEDIIRDCFSVNTTAFTF